MPSGSNIARWAVGLGICASLLSCGAQNSSDKNAHAEKQVTPAEIAKVSIETTLTTVKLSDQAAERLGIATVPVTRREVQKRRTYGGFVEASPPGKANLIAPASGTVVAIGDSATQELTLGSAVERDEVVISIAPFSTNDDSPLSATERSQLTISQMTLTQGRLGIDERIASARIELSAAKTAFERASQLLADKVGSQRTVDESRAALEIANRRLSSAIAERDALGNGGTAEDLFAPVVLKAPISGRITNLLCVPGQIVSSGQPLADIVDFNLLWARVPVPRGELGSLLLDQSGYVQPLNAKTSDPGFDVEFRSDIPTADAAATTLDIYCDLPAGVESMRPGQRISVSIATQVSGSHLVVPVEAVLYDIYGGSWVYHESSPNSFIRERIQILFTDEGEAILETGPDEGMLIVTSGAVELFGAEFGNE